MVAMKIKRRANHLYMQAYNKDIAELVSWLIVTINVVFYWISSKIQGYFWMPLTWPFILWASTALYNCVSKVDA